MNMEEERRCVDHGMDKTAKNGSWGPELVAVGKGADPSWLHEKVEEDAQDFKLWQCLRYNEEKRLIRQPHVRRS